MGRKRVIVPAWTGQKRMNSYYRFFQFTLLAPQVPLGILASRLEAADHEGVCFYEYQIMVNVALDNMRMAHYYYRALVNKANATPYNQSVINQLDPIRKEFTILNLYIKHEGHCDVRGRDKSTPLRQIARYNTHLRM